MHEIALIQFINNELVVTFNNPKNVKYFSSCFLLSPSKESSKDHQETLNIFLGYPKYNKYCIKKKIFIIANTGTIALEKKLEQ